ncbi:transmembrane protein, putative [Bodo saltans]|uniref:Transmembrane protein, putative n=1 Tax=Bodo saltans TaxID=75058 RepID=A0A0S4J168_BODSA|nr:transmembrane protein, putative [Bodo saltans]|eukprot:CUG44352.1 transmembrane protein, putative [Bodo saltans]
MPPRSRSRSTTPAPKAVSKSQSPVSRPSGRASGTAPAAPSTPRVSNEVQAIIDEALAKARAARGLPITGPLTASSAADDGERDSAPERAQISGGFFSHNDRVYSRQTTQCLTDLAGFLLLVFMAFYFSVSGYVFYQEFSK